MQQEMQREVVEHNPNTPNPTTQKVVLVFIALCLVAFMWGAVRSNQQAQQINKLIDEQSPLIFAFQNTGTSGRITFEVTCTRIEDPKTGALESKYVCTTKQTEPVVAVITPTSTPTPTVTPQPR